MCKKVLLLFYALACLSAVAQTQYTITESELLQLESISENWQRNKQSLQLQVRNLKAELSEAHKLSEILNEQLRTERQTSNALRQSFSAYEKEAARIQAEQQAIIDRQKDTLHRRMIAVITLSAILSIIIFITGIKYFLKFKFSLFHPP